MYNYIVDGITDMSMCQCINVVKIQQQSMCLCGNVST